MTEWREGDSVCALVAGGGYAEYCLAPAPQCLPVPKGLTAVEAAGIPETFFTVWTNVFERGRLAAGETLLVHGGSSGIGTVAIQLARAFGAHVLATAGSPEKCAACATLGAERAINYRDEDFVAVVKERTGGRGADVILDMVGGDYIPRNVDCLALEGRLVLIALQRGARAELNFATLLFRRLTITGSSLRPRTIEQKGAIARARRGESLAAPRVGPGAPRHPRPLSPRRGRGRPPPHGVGPAYREAGIGRGPLRRCSTKVAPDPGAAGHRRVRAAGLSSRSEAGLRPDERMSRRLRERHHNLLRAEVLLRAVPRAGSFRIALCYPNLYFVGMSNLGFQGVYQMLNAARRGLRARLPARRRGPRRARAARRHAADQLRDRARPRPLRRGRLLGLVRERLPARAADAAHGGHPAARGRPRDRRSAGGARRRGAVPEPGAAGALRRPDRGGRGRGAGAAADGGAAGRADPRAGLEHARPRRTASTCPRATRCATTTTARWPPTTGPGPVVRQRGWPGKMAAAAVRDPDAAHRDVDEVHGRDLARLSLHVPLLLGGLQLPAGARLLAPADRRPRARGAARTRTRSGSSRPRSATTPRSTASWTTWPGWATRSRWRRCGSTT